MQSTRVPVTEATASASANSSRSSVQPKFGQSPTTPAASHPGDAPAQCRGNPKAEAELKRAIEREFELRKNSLVQSGRRNPVERVAAFLLAVSQINKREGRDANVVDTSWQCAFVADQLDLSIDLLARILLEFEKRGLIESCLSGGLRLKDLAALEALAGERNTSLLLRDITDCRKRCRCTLVQGQTLFSEGDEAPKFYVVESGILLLEGPDSPPSGHQPRILSTGDVFSLDEGGTPVASCEALTDAVVVCVDRTAPDRGERSFGRNTLMSAIGT